MELKGTAKLDDYNLSIIGGSKTTREVEFHLQEGSLADVATKPGWQEGLHAPALGGAQLAFTEADWELRSKDTWWCYCYIPIEQLQPIFDQAAQGKITSMTVCLGLGSMYQDEHSLAPPGPKKHLFVRGTALASGHVRALSVGLVKHKMEPLPLERWEEPEPIVDEEIPAPAEPVPDPVAIATYQLAANVEKLRSTLKWVGGFVIVGLLIVAGNLR